jgi:hypothetical protein
MNDRAATRVIVTGDRNWRCLELARRIMARLTARYGDGLTIIHGGATGVDAAFDLAALEARVSREPHPADWHQYGDRAGPLRNQIMVDRGAAFAIAVHRTLERSRGTRDCVRRCLAAGIAVYLIDAEQAEPRRVAELPRADGR